MCNKLFKLASIVLIIVMVVTTFATAVSAQTVFSLYTLEIEDIVNPLNQCVEESEPSKFSITPKKYYSNSDFNPDIYITDIEEVAADIRNVMVARSGSINIYYKCDIQYDSDGIQKIFEQWVEMAVSETENPDEGDYLRWVYKKIGPSGDIEVLSDGEYFYYKFPLYFLYYTTRDQENVLDARIDEVIEDFGFDAYSTQKEKSDAIYEFITDNVEYDHENLNDDSHTLKYTAYAALINGTAVCQGYATLYYRLARECGLETRVITGTSRGENHAWNIVKIGSEYYYLDSTWDAGETKYDYYLKGSINFTSDHTPEDRYLETEFTQKYPISETDISLSGEGQTLAYDYDIYMGKAIITRYKGDEKNIVVPASLNGYPVERIGRKVFFENNKIESITFSEGIEHIETETIAFCRNLKQINFPASMAIDFEKYGDAALGGYTTAPYICHNLETITLAPGNTKMKLVDGILYTSDGTGVILCPPKYNKSKVTILDGVTTIAPFAFYGCEGIKEVIMPDTVKYIGYWAFDVARNLEKVNISEDCRIIGQFAFANTKLTDIYIPASVEQIVGGAFGMECDLKEITVDPENEYFYMQNGALIYHNKEFDTRVIFDYETDNAATVFTVPDNVGYIEQYAFALANNLEQIVLHDGVENISSYAFENSKKLSHFEFPNGIKRVESYVLVGCDGLASVIIPASVTEIGESVIFGNYGCTIYGQSGSAAESYALSNGNPFKTIDQFICTSGHNLVHTFKNEYDHCFVCQNCGDETQLFSIIPIEPFAQFAKTEYETYKYTGSEIKPQIAEFEYDGKEFVEGVDYKITGYYGNVNVGTGYIEVEGIGDYAGKGYIYFQIMSAPISKKEIEIEYLSTVYDGYEKFPIIQIDGLREFEDFSVEYSNNINPGTATATITAWGNYEGTIQIDFEIVLPATEKVATALYGGNDVKVAWREVVGADGYLVYYKKSSSSSYTYKASTKSLSYNFANLSYSTKYDFKVVAYYLDGAIKTPSSKYKTASATTLRNLSAPSKVTLTLYGYDDVKVSWEKVSYAKGYYVYYKKSSAKTYTYAGKTTSTSFKKSNLSDGVKYTFKVVPYGVSGSKVVLDDSYKTASVYTLKKISTPKITKSSSKKVKVSWTNINGESGYQISQATSKSKTKIVSTYTTTSGKSKTISAKKGKTYYYKVRAFVKVGKTVIYGPWSTVKSYKIK